MRLFFALWPTSAVADALAGLAREAVVSIGGKATRAETIHLTLAFLGEHPAAQLPAIVAAAKTVRMAPFEMTIDRLVIWRRNQLLWAGCESVPEPLPALALALREAMRQAGIAFDETHTTFAPHVSLVRKLPAQVTENLPLFGPLLWRSERFVLVESCLSNAGPFYRVVAEFPGI